jgi:prephenate dehydrogenase
MFSAAPIPAGALCYGFLSARRGVVAGRHTETRLRVKIACPRLEPSPPRPCPWPRTVAIAGLGMLGGSLGLALRRLPRPPRVLGWARRPAAVAAALAEGMIDAGSTRPEEVLPLADLTVLCLPVERCREFGLAHAGLWRRGAVVTDVGSTKRRLVAGLTPALARHGVRFVGSHPMAGSEKSGLAHAQADLYHGAVVFVTPGPASDPRALRRVERFWGRLGARPVALAATRHDALVARTSHVLHLYSAAAVLALLRGAADVHGTAGGFRDFTRIAASSPAMWAEIFAANRDEVLKALGRVEAEVARAAALVRAGDWAALERYLERARARRQAWFEAWSRLRGGAS